MPLLFLHAFQLLNNIRWGRLHFLSMSKDRRLYKNVFQNAKDGALIMSILARFSSCSNSLFDRYVGIGCCQSPFVSTVDTYSFSYIDYFLVFLPKPSLLDVEMLGMRACLECLLFFTMLCVEV